jgi:hypothetical protein
MGFCLGRIMRIKKLEDRWKKELVKLQKTFNEILEKAGILKNEKIGLGKRKEEKIWNLMKNIT